jgi:hypothetical protein
MNAHQPIHRRGALALFASTAVLPHAALAQRLPAAPRDTLVKAAFLHKFASFVEWPDGTFPRADTPLRIGILGDEVLWRDLIELARDRDRDGRPVYATRIAPGDALTGYHILYFKAPSPARVMDLLAGVPEGVLTVADSDGAHPRGAVLSFFHEEGRVGFGVSVEAAGRQKLRLNPRLISAARRMQGVADGDTQIA